MTSGGFSPPPENTDEASPGRSRHQNRVVWSFEAETRMWPKGWKASAQTLESWACESVARGPGWVAVMEGRSSDVGGADAADMSQWRIAPSEPPETSIGWNGCHAIAAGTR